MKQSFIVLKELDMKKIRKAYCKYCEHNVHLFKMNGWRFVPHGDSLGSCPNTGFRVALDKIIITK